MKKIRMPLENTVILTGRLTQEPELRFTSAGQPVCRFRIATNRVYRDSEGRLQQETSYIPIVVWRDAAMRCSERLRKGSPVYINGRLRSREWEDRDGKKQRILEVVAQKIQFLEYEVKVEAEVPEEVGEEVAITEEVSVQPEEEETT